MPPAIDGSIDDRGTDTDRDKYYNCNKHRAQGHTNDHNDDAGARHKSQGVQTKEEDRSKSQPPTPNNAQMGTPHRLIVVSLASLTIPLTPNHPKKWER